MNVLRFNWRTYGAAVLAVAALGVAAALAGPPWRPWCLLTLAAIVVPSLLSILVTHHVYDRSGLYAFPWLDRPGEGDLETIVTITAGFDETSPALRPRYPRAALRVLDFHDALQRVEPSLRAARLLHPPTPGSERVAPAALPLPSASADRIFVIFAAHEIRDQPTRLAFFRELRRALKPHGRVIVMEHVRDLANVLAYTIGALHFHSRAAWRRAFAGAGLRIDREVACTPFVTTFILEPHDPPP
ncbi:MAG: methyltransferase domain-containing protein [Planctomycetes bacterium]|nr:methyltransferase domain-containing protein [Planctomycetota bacterium]